MTKDTYANQRPSSANSNYLPASRLSWLWLVVGASLTPFITAQTSLWFAAWLSPLFLLRFSRTIRPAIALPVIGAVFFVGNWIAFRGGFMPMAGIELYFTLAGIALAYMAVFAIDRFMHRRVGGVASTLIFPLASTAVSFLATFGNPLGTAGSEAYSQTSAGLLQLVSITGIWGIVFLMAWFASAANAIWEKGLKAERLAAGLFAAILLAVTTFGAVRLTFFTPTHHTVRVAALAPDRTLNEQSHIDISSDGRSLSANRAILTQLTDDLFARTEHEARAGTKIVVWSEATAKILKEDEATFLARAKDTARAHNIYLQIGLATFRNQNGSLQTENRAIMFTPAGSTAWDYHKAKLTPGDNEKPGDGIMPSIDTPYGKIATIICQDDLFPSLVNQAGREGVDILLLPSSDWQAVAEWHARVAAFRAVENGLSIVRPTRQGESLAVDPAGNVLARKADYFVSDQQTLVASIPTKGTATIYPHIGDIAAYLATGCLVALATVALIRTRRSKAK